MQHIIFRLYDTVKEGEKHGVDPNKVKTITDEIVELQNQIL